MTSSSRATHILPNPGSSYPHQQQHSISPSSPAVHDMYNSAHASVQRAHPGPPLDKQQYIQYFDLYNLPLLRTFQPSPIWDTLVQPRLHHDCVIQDIAAAIVSFLWKDIEQPPLTREARRSIAESHHASALRSLHASLADVAPDEGAVTAMGCLLMVILESLRGNPVELFIHLQGGMRVLGLPVSQHEDPEAHQEASRLFRQLAISSVLFRPETFAARETLRMTSTLHQPSLTGPTSINARTLSNELYDIIHRLLQLYYRYQSRPGAISIDLGAFETLAPLRQRHTTLEENIKHLDDHPDLQQSGPVFWKLLKARTKLTGLQFDMLWRDAHLRTHERTQTCQLVIDLIHSSLNDLKAIGFGPNSPFSVGLGIVSMVRLLSKYSEDPSIATQATALLELCPRQEGVWNAKKVHDSACEGILAEHSDSDSGRPETQKKEWGKEGYITFDRSPPPQAFQQMQQYHNGSNANNKNSPGSNGNMGPPPTPPQQGHINGTPPQGMNMYAPPQPPQSNPSPHHISPTTQQPPQHFNMNPPPQPQHPNMNPPPPHQYSHINPSQPPYIYHPQMNGTPPHSNGEGMPQHYQHPQQMNMNMNMNDGQQQKQWFHFQ